MKKRPKQPDNSSSFKTIHPPKRFIILALRKITGKSFKIVHILIHIADSPESMDIKDVPLFRQLETENSVTKLYTRSDERVTWKSLKRIWYAPLNGRTNCGMIIAYPFQAFIRNNANRKPKK
ncbi:MAG: hypothetical protein GY757_35565 [bacterium]|nr:hypothetical protein [bacterium]